MAEKLLLPVNPISPDEIGHDLTEKYPDHTFWVIHQLPSGGTYFTRTVDPEIQALMPNISHRRRLGAPLSVRIRAFIDGIINN